MRYLGIGPRQDQVTVNLRAVDIRTGDIIQSVTTTKTIFSIQMDFGMFKYVSYQHLVEIEAGFSQKEPVQQCVREAIENGLIHLIAQESALRGYRHAVVVAHGDGVAAVGAFSERNFVSAARVRPSSIPANRPFRRGQATRDQGLQRAAD